MCTQPTQTSTPLSPKPLNPHAESWLPEAKNSSTIPDLHQHPPPLEPMKSLDNNIMFPHEIYTRPSPSSLTLAAVSPLFHPPPPPLLIPHYFYQAASFEQYYQTWNLNGVSSTYYNLGFLPQPTIIPSGILSTLIPGVNLKEGMDEDVIEVKRDSEVFWKKNSSSKRFVPFRLRMNSSSSSSSLEYQGTKKTLGKVWKPKKANCNDGVTAGGTWGGGVVFSSPHHPPPSLPSPKETSRFCSNTNTTVMIKNVPNQYGRDDLMQFLDTYCKKYNLEYDFLYLPMDFRTNDNLGYAFVNFTAAAGATKIKFLLQGFKWYGNQLQKGTIFSKKICNVTWAKIQGKDALVKHFENSNFTCDNIEFLPVVLSPPRNGSETMILPKTLGNLKGLHKSPRSIKNAT